MNIVNAGNKFQIYGEELKTYKELPIDSYEICFNKMQGFYLVKRENLQINEEKVYGTHHQKVTKVLNSFENINRNFGVILSGQKGIGKSLFARVLTTEAIKRNIPLILVNNYYAGIASFIESIEQEVIVLFDEFEKTFAENDNFSPQEEMLTLFDGTNCGKKLFVITCNETRKLNNYLLNRPGRFHYHFTITNPSPDEVREYMMDKLDEQYYHYINKIVGFSMTINMTYDYLRAIAFELNNGYSLEETLTDLNITKESMSKFTIKFVLDNGIELINTKDIDMYSQGTICMWFPEYNYPSIKVSMGFQFPTSDIIMDAENNNIILPIDSVKILYEEDEFENRSEEEINEIKSRKIVNIVVDKYKQDFINKYVF